MKRWTSTWAALVVAGFLVVPGSGFAQTPAAPTAPATTTQDKAEQGTPQEHLERADAALKSISPAAANGKAKSANRRAEEAGERAAEAHREQSVWRGCCTHRCEDREGRCERRVKVGGGSSCR